MAQILMPALGADMETGRIVQWKVGPGAAVHRGDIVAYVETDKGVVGIESFHDGTMAELLVPVGRRVAVGAPIATMEGAAAADD